MHMYMDTYASRVNILLQHATNKTQASSDGSSSGQRSNQTCSQHPACQFVPALTQLLQQSIAPTTVKVYDRALTKYRQFLLTYSLPIELPSSPIVIALYATYMHQLEYAYRTIVTHMTDISHMHKYYQMSEPTKNVFVQRTLQGIKQSAISVECRMPITLPLLHKLHVSLNHIVSSPRT